MDDELRKAGRKGTTGGSRNDRTVLVVDDHDIVRLGLRGFLEMAGWTVVGEAADLSSARTALSVWHPAILLLDLSLGAENGLDLLRLPTDLAAGPTRVILYSMFLTADTIQEAQHLGVTGFISKSAPQEFLQVALAEVLAGRVYRSPDVEAGLANSPEEGEPLPPREAEILRLLGRGFRLTEIADQLALSVKTVDTYVSRLCRKLGFDSRKALIRHAVERAQKRF
ncbi:MAG: response regulator transcription factor [Candidatus Riflebacteria bacterium]|nr:response regulator transcription factor [Candidatus Riflebacteria bacterium]